jgi:hypothetical protein
MSFQAPRRLTCQLATNGKSDQLQPGSGRLISGIAGAAAGKAPRAAGRLIFSAGGSGHSGVVEGGSCRCGSTAGWRRGLAGAREAAAPDGALYVMAGWKPRAGWAPRANGWQGGIGTPRKRGSRRLCEAEGEG